MNRKGEWKGLEVQKDERMKCEECHAIKLIEEFYHYDEICKECFKDDTEHPFHQNPE